MDNGIDITLNELGFHIGDIVETIVVTKHKGILNVAPMGVKRVGLNAVRIMPYKSSQTYRNLKTTSKAVINLTNDPTLFFSSAFKKEFYVKPEVTEDMILEEANAAIFCKKKRLEVMNELRVSFDFNVFNIIIMKNLPQVFSRGNAEAIEAIIHTTRIKVYHDQGKIKEVKNLIKKVLECFSVIERVSVKDSKALLVANQLRNLLQRWGITYGNNS